MGDSNEESEVLLDISNSSNLGDVGCIVGPGLIFVIDFLDWLVQLTIA